MKDIKEIQECGEYSLIFTVYKCDISGDTLKITCQFKQHRILKEWLGKDKFGVLDIYYHGVCGECFLGKYDDDIGTLFCTFKSQMMSEFRKHIRNSICKISLNLISLSSIDGTSKFALEMKYHREYSTVVEQVEDPPSKKSTMPANFLGPKSNTRYPPNQWAPNEKEGFIIQIYKEGVSHVQPNGDVLTTQEIEQNRMEKRTDRKSEFLVDVKEKPKQKYHSSSDSPKSKPGANKNRPKSSGGEELSMDRYFP